MKTRKFDDKKRRWMKDPAFRAEYDALEEEYSIAAGLIRARARAGLTQAEVAKRMGTTQSAVARLEGGRPMPKIETLRRYAEAVGCQIVVRFRPVQQAAP